MNVKDIQQLNEKIEGLMKTKAKTEAQKEVWENKLHESLAEYEKQYGVKLEGTTLAEIKQSLTKEFNKVKADTEDQYELAQKVVGMIDRGDIEGAYSALGIEHKTEVEETVNDWMNAGLGTETEKEVPTEVVEEVTEAEETLTGADDIVKEMEQGNISTPKIGFDDDDEEVPVSKAPVISFDDDDDSDFVTQPSKITMEDEESTSAFGGFGDILAGSKFQMEE